MLLLAMIRFDVLIRTVLVAPAEAPHLDRAVEALLAAFESSEPAPPVFRRAWFPATNDRIRPSRQLQGKPAKPHANRCLLG